MVQHKKILAIYQIILAILCFIAFFLYTFNMRYPFDLRIHSMQSAILATGIICLFFGCGYWWYYSNFPEIRWHVRILSVIVLLVFNVILAIMVIVCAVAYLGDEIDNFEKESWDNSVLIMLTIAIILSIIVAVLMIPMNAFLIWKIKKKKA